MNGRIKSLNTANRSGFIAAENGLTVGFSLSAVLAYDVTCLAAGQWVSFDIEDGTGPRAVNVCVRKRRRDTPAPQKREPGAWLRYLGFEQKGSVRSYRFDRISPGQDNVTFIVTTDLSLFLRHRVSIQEGPALCLHVLSAELDGTAPPTWPLPSRGLTERDMLEHLAHRPVGAKHGPGRDHKAH